ncbi:ketopantoate reductase family protein [Aureimonas populi]|uniref:2-dehydropantoate 2-reductase n=1 Tax=Aureimonas populi TaxID=1701758 RepID=A0ABW5CIE8_9HYPH|nr:ketopantoate reductase C-terminal domain-containing protein [Aureimonas populi]
MSDPAITIIGAGAIGSFLATRLAEAGLATTLVARGARLEQLRARAPALCGGAKGHRGRIDPAPRATGPADILFLCVKAHALREALAANGAANGPGTTVVPLVNGIPFWHFADRPEGERSVPVIDPEGAILAAAGPHAVLGCVTYIAAELTGDGDVLSPTAPRLALGPARAGGPDGRAVAALAARAGIDVERPRDIRSAVWHKLAINLATNPLSALTDTSVGEIAANAELLAIAADIAAEVRALAAAYGFDTGLSAEGLAETMAAANDFSTSMRQDARAGRPLELGAICHAPLALAARAGVAMPVTRSIVHLLAASAPGKVRPAPAPNLEREVA